MKQSTRVRDEMVRERIAVLKADREFAMLRRLLPRKLKGKELGTDVQGMTTDLELWQHNKEMNVLLSKPEMKKYEDFCSLCEKLAEKYGLQWATVADLAMGVRRPTGSPHLSRIIKVSLDPITMCPKDFNPNSRYKAYLDFAQPLAATEIMRLVQGLDEQTKQDVKAYLLMLVRSMPGCQILHMVKAEASGKPLENEVEIDVRMTIPLGYTVKEVAEVYRKEDLRRREILAALGTPVPKRRRVSKILVREAAVLQLPTRKVNIYDILDEVDPNRDESQDEEHRRSIINRRYKARSRLKDRYRH